MVGLSRLGEVILSSEWPRWLGNKHGFAYVFCGAKPHKYWSCGSRVLYIGKAHKRCDRRVFDSLGDFWESMQKSNQVLKLYSGRIELFVLPASAETPAEFLERALLEAFGRVAGDRETWGRYPCSGVLPTG